MFVLLYIYITTQLCIRLIRVKSDSSRFLTNVNLNLRLMSPSYDAIPNQYVIVHKRKLYFYSGGKFMSIVMYPNDIRAHLKETILFDRLEVGLVKRKIIDVFGMDIHKENPDKLKATNQFKVAEGSQNNDNTKPEKYGAGYKKKQEYGTSYKKKQELSTPNKRSGYKARKPTLSYDKQVRDNERKFRENSRAGRLIDRENSRTERGSDVKNRDTGITRQRRYDDRKNIDNVDDADTEQYDAKKRHRDTLEYNRPGQHSNESCPYNHLDEKNETETYHKKLRSLVDEFHIESDSKMQDNELTTTVKDVMIEEVGKGSFRLVGQNRSCLTYFASDFIFAPCSTGDTQLFSLEKAEEVVRKLHYGSKGMTNHVPKEDNFASTQDTDAEQGHPDTETSISSSFSEKNSSDRNLKLSTAFKNLNYGHHQVQDNNAVYPSFGHSKPTEGLTTAEMASQSHSLGKPNYRMQIRASDKTQGKESTDPFLDNALGISKSKDGQEAYSPTNRSTKVDRKIVHIQARRKPEIPKAEETKPDDEFIDRLKRAFSMDDFKDIM